MVDEIRPASVFLTCIVGSFCRVRIIIHDATLF